MAGVVDVSVGVVIGAAKAVPAVTLAAVPVVSSVLLAVFLYTYLFVCYLFNGFVRSNYIASIRKRLFKNES